VLAKVAATPVADISPDTILLPWAVADGVAATQSVEVTLPAYCSGSGEGEEKRELRASSAAAKQQLASHWMDVYSRPALAAQLQTLKVKAEATKYEGWSPELKRMLTTHLSRFNRSGAGLEPAQRDHVQHLRQRCGELCAAIEQNINEDTTKVAFQMEALAGVPASYLGAAPRDADGMVLVGLKTPEYTPVMKYCPSFVAFLSFTTRFFHWVDLRF
jgi:Zn-dependent oligopeptidase